jgi:transposase-like protein
MATTLCKITDVGRRRDGGTRYWCLSHRADATAKYGKPADQCVAANDPEVGNQEALHLDPANYPGGIALWGAVPPVYDTTRLPMERGIHVHARLKPGSKHKPIDHTYRRITVAMRGGQLFDREMAVSELDAIYFMVSSVFGMQVKDVKCTLCGYPHLDKDWFSVHNHQRHLCHGCGRNFRDSEPGIGNPVALLQQEIEGTTKRQLISAPEVLELEQADYPGGIQIWGSNPALLWTASKPEETGIHVHAFKKGGEPAKDGTYRRVTIDGIRLDPEMVRYFMAQSAMPHIEPRVVPLKCPRCDRLHFDRGEHGYTPQENHKCEFCKAKFQSTTRLKLVIGNPMRHVVSELAQFAPRPPQQFNLGLRPETISSQ